jgi:hypothetical protein
MCVNSGYSVCECCVAAEHEAELGGLVEDLVEADAHEVDEHQLGDRAHARGGRTDGSTDESRLRDRRVEDAVGVLRLQALGGAQRAAPRLVDSRGAAGTAGDVLPEHDHALVAGHLLMHRLVDGEQVAQLACHVALLSPST